MVVHELGNWEVRGSNK